MKRRRSLTITDSIIYLLISSEIIGNTILPMLFPIPIIALQGLMYGSMFLVTLLFAKGIFIEYRILFLIVASILSLIMNDIEVKYGAPYRFISWLLLLATIGPLVYSPALLRFRHKMLEIFFQLFMIIGGISFLYWLLRIPSIGRGHFSGVMNQSMILAPIASLGALYAFYRFIQEPKGNQKTIFLILFIFGALSVILAASRTALVAFSLSFSVYLIFNRFRFKSLVLIGLLVSTIYLANGMDDDRIDESESKTITSDILSRGTENTRETLWNDRIREFKSSPIFGVGFASQNNQLSETKSRDLGGRIEPGSTYLMVLSMTGIIGMIALIFFFFKPLLSYNFWMRVSSWERYKLASFIFFIVHFVAEGYIFSSGSLMACVFWLLVGATYPYQGLKYSKVLRNL